MRTLIRIISASFVIVASLATSAIATSSTASAATPGPFTCQPGFYQVISGKLVLLDPTTHQYQDVGSGVTHLTYNAIGYNTADNYIYGIGTDTTGSNNQTHLLKIDNDGGITDLGIPTGGITIGNYVVGDFDNSGNLIVKSATEWWKINVTTNVATQINPTGPSGDGRDIVNINGVGYLLKDQTLTRIDLTTYVETTDTVSGLPGGTNQYGAAWTDAKGELFFGNNTTGDLYQVSDFLAGSATPPSAAVALPAAVTSNNDGAACPTAANALDPPSASNDTYHTAYQTKLTISTSGILSNDSGTSITVANNSNPEHGTVSVNGDGTFTYTPNDGFSGVDTFRYTIVDSFGRTATAVVSITVAPQVGALANTGNVSVPTVVAALLMLIVGGLLLLIPRLRA